ncbi:hypothetical protein A5724_20305 [Mycobacterium sp. ACS1612]|uniref:DUF4352 domain-containing protein n=1 Tax=Mycobacterium sp. ACS1612 TaxID=1834117 RepID=UPI0008015D16|nr:DUF4352 domain-containing protein [Mycobacterium sp. ACS1612]OBF32975.1 hypothetical protein A5724_20305 [Mycobacterium sp. ACS1612]
MSRHAAPRRRSGRELGLLIGLGVTVVAAIGVVVAGVVLAVRMDVDEPAVAAQTTSAEAASAPPAPLPAVQIPAADVAAPEVAPGEFVVVQMTVTNVAAEPRTYTGSFHTLSDGATAYTPDDEAWLYFGNLPPRLNPGESTDSSVVFDVPVGADVESIELHDGPGSTGVTVHL